MNRNNIFPVIFLILLALLFSSCGNESEIGLPRTIHGSQLAEALQEALDLPDCQAQEDGYIRFSRKDGEQDFNLVVNDNGLIIAIEWDVTVPDRDTVRNMRNELKKKYEKYMIDLGEGEENDFLDVSFISSETEYHFLVLQSRDGEYMVRHSIRDRKLYGMYIPEAD